MNLKCPSNITEGRTDNVTVRQVVKSLDYIGRLRACELPESPPFSQAARASQTQTDGRQTDRILLTITQADWQRQINRETNELLF